MSIDPRFLPDHIKERIDPRDKAVLARGLGSHALDTRAEIHQRESLRLEREEQRVFASWCQLNALPYCWHATHKRTNATVGVFDFWVGKDSRSAWIEFKSPGAKLRPEQQQFAKKLEAQGIDWRLVHNAAEAIEFVKNWRN